MAHLPQRLGFGQGVDGRRWRIGMKNRAQRVAQKIGGWGATGFARTERRTLKASRGDKTHQDGAEQ
ncbi:MAG: hypothetical protein GVY35_06840 [Bacteroidetes bacterium]|nr:hypothetical protein [Bacteroidota bacterium]